VSQKIKWCKVITQWDSVLMSTLDEMVPVLLSTLDEMVPV